MNLSKTKLMTTGYVSNGELSSILGCAMESLPSSFLELMIGARPTSKSL